MIEIFKKYGGQYDLDYLLMAAQGYQESQLDQSKRSHVGRRSASCRSCPPRRATRP